MKKSIIILGASVLLLAVPSLGFAADSQAQPVKVSEEGKAVAAATGKYVSGIVGNVAHKPSLLPKTYFYVQGTWAGTLTYTDYLSNGNGEYRGVYAGYIYNSGIE